MGRRNTCVTLIIIVIFAQLTDPVVCWNTCLLKPGFVSGWNTITAQSISTNHKVTYEHGIGTLPLKVDIRVRPKPSQPESNFYFPGIGSSQRDDDVNSPYGGIVYVYDGEGVQLFTPVKNDGYDAGTAIYTGGNVWVGPVQQSEKSVEVQVRVWGQQHFPAPDFESQWLPMDTNTNTYQEVTHGLGQEHEYTLVQVKLSSGLFTEAIGYSAEISGTSQDWGGVIYAYDSTKFKLWAPNNGTGGIFSNADGWGDDGKLIKNGEVKIYAWKVFNAERKFSQSTNLPSKSIMDLNNSLDRDNDLFDVKVRAIDGRNKDFMFHASGAVQNVLTNRTIGGIVYSYSDKQFRFWRPKIGPLILVSSSWGSSNTQHSSTQAKVFVEIYKNYHTCPPVTTMPMPPKTTELVSTVKTTTFAPETTQFSTPIIKTTHSQETTELESTVITTSLPPETTQLVSTVGTTTETKTTTTTARMTSMSTNQQTFNETNPEYSHTKKKWFSFSHADVPTMLVGTVFGVAGSLLSFLVIHCIRRMLNKGSENEVKPFRKRRDTNTSLSI